jgi:hypothetical protein
LESHVKALGLLNILLGAFGGLVAIVFFGVFGGVSVGSDSNPLYGFATVGLMVLMLVLAGPAIAIGIGLLHFRIWSRTAATVLAIVDLLNFPLGTVLGIYALWVLLSPETDPLFNPRFNSLYIRRP